MAVISLRSRVQALLLAIIALIAGLSAAVLITLQLSHKETSRLRDVLEPAQQAAGQLLSAVIDQNNAVRAFVASGDDSQLQGYQVGGADSVRAWTELQQGLRHDPALLRMVNIVARDSDTWRNSTVAPAISARRALSGPAAADLLDSDAGQEGFTRLAGDVRALRQAINQQISRTQRHNDALTHRLLVILAASVAPVCVLALLVVLAMERWVTRPLGALLDEVGRVADGDLTRDVPAIGPPELGELGNVVNQMRLRLLAEAGDALRARQALVQGGLAVLTLSAELGPSPIDLPENVTVAARLRPAEGVLAGDWWDAVRIGDDGSKLAFVVADVSGHGAVAGIVALRTKQLVLAALRLGQSPGEVLSWVAQELGDTGDYFLTCVVVELDPATGLVRWANAGHPPPIVAGASRLDRLQLTGPLLGGIGTEWETAELLLDAGDTLAIYTDGLTETRNPLGDEFGGERLVASIVRRLGQPLDDIADACIAEVEHFGFSRVGDDLTLVLVGCQPAGALQPEPAPETAESGAE